MSWVNDRTGLTLRYGKREFDVHVERRSDDDLSIELPRFRAHLMGPTWGGGETGRQAMVNLAEALETLAQRIREGANKR